MRKRRVSSKTDSRLAKERRTAKERRAEILTYLVIAIVLGLILFGFYLQTLHHS